jgi:hypothetical protein
MMLQTEKHEYFKSAFSVCYELETFSNQIVQAKKFEGRKYKFLSLNSHKSIWAPVAHPLILATCEAETERMTGHGQSRQSSLDPISTNSWVQGCTAIIPIYQGN